MEYRQLPHGTAQEKFSVLGLGFGGIGKTPPDEIEAIVRKALDHGINFFDLCTAGATYAPPRTCHRQTPGIGLSAGSFWCGL